MKRLLLRTCPIIVGLYAAQATIGVIVFAAPIWAERWSEVAEAWKWIF